MKENIIFLRNEWTTTGYVDKTDRMNRSRQMYSPIGRNTRKHKRFRQKNVFVRCKKIDKRGRKQQQQKDSGKEDADVKTNIFKNVKNVYVDLKRCHQNDEN